MDKSDQKRFSLRQIWHEIPTVARLIVVGLCLISSLVVAEFIHLVIVPGPVVRDENLYVHVALLFLVPGATSGMIGVAFGYAYYQLCKKNNRKPFWADFLNDKP